MSVRKQVFKKIKEIYENRDPAYKKYDLIMTVADECGTNTTYVSQLVVFLKDISVLEEFWKLGEPYLKRGKQFEVIDNFLEEKRR